jgi:hypothetical protein
MNDVSTLNISKEDLPRFTQLHLAYQTKEKRRVSSPEYISYVLCLLEHLSDCAVCEENFMRHTRTEKKRK